MFLLFRKLPIELQGMIWIEATRPMTLKFIRPENAQEYCERHLDGDSSNPISGSRSVLFHRRDDEGQTAYFEESVSMADILRPVCRQARNLIERCCIEVTSSQNNGLPSRFSFEHEIVQFSHGDLQGMLQDYREFLDIQHLRVTFSKMEWQIFEKEKRSELNNKYLQESITLLWEGSRKLNTVTFEVVLAEGEAALSDKPSDWVGVLEKRYTSSGDCLEHKELV